MPAAKARGKAKEKGKAKAKEKGKAKAKAKGSGPNGPDGRLHCREGTADGTSKGRHAGTTWGVNALAHTPTLPTPGRPKRH